MKGHGRLIVWIKVPSFASTERVHCSGFIRDRYKCTSQKKTSRIFLLMPCFHYESIIAVYKIYRWSRKLWWSRITGVYQLVGSKQITSVRPCSMHTHTLIRWAGLILHNRCVHRESKEAMHPHYSKIQGFQLLCTCMISDISDVVLAHML